MTRKLELPPLPIVRDTDETIQKDLLHPHYDDPRFPEKNIGRIVFLAPDLQLEEGERIPEAAYMDSDRYSLWSEFSGFNDNPASQEFVPNSAKFFEAALNDLWPRLYENSSAVQKIGQDIDRVRLLAITSRINGFNLYPINEFVVAPQDPDDL